MSLTDFTGLIIAVISFGLGYLIARNYRWSNKTNQLVSIIRTITTEDKKAKKGEV